MLKAKTKADEAVSVLTGSDAEMIEYADAAMTLIDHIGIRLKDYEKIAKILAEGLLENGHIEDDDDGVNHDKALARLMGEEG